MIFDSPDQASPGISSRIWRIDIENALRIDLKLAPCLEALLRCS